MRNRKGKFTLDLDFLENDCNDLLRYIMRDVIVVDMQYCIAERTVTYWAYHPSFAELREGDIVPTYVCTVGTPKKWIQHASD